MAQTLQRQQKWQQQDALNNLKKLLPPMSMVQSVERGDVRAQVEFVAQIFGLIA